MTRTALYRHFDAAGALLYVGISLSAVQRLGQHRDRSGWYSQIAQVSIEWFTDRRLALAAESLAIAQEKPLRNVQKTRFHVAPRSGDTFAIEHAGTLRRDGNYFGEDVAVEMLGWWRETFPRDRFEIVRAPAGKVGGATGGHGALRESNACAWSTPA